MPKKTLEDWFAFVRKTSPLDDADLEKAFDFIRAEPFRGVIEDVENFVDNPQPEFDDPEDPGAGWRASQAKAATGLKEVAKLMSAAGSKVGWADPVKPYGSKLQLTSPNAFAHLIDAWAAWRIILDGCSSTYSTRG